MGVSLGVLALIGVLALAFYFLRRRSRAKGRSELSGREDQTRNQDPPSKSPYTDTSPNQSYQSYPLQKVPQKDYNPATAHELSSERTHELSSAVPVAELSPETPVGKQNRPTGNNRFSWQGTRT